MDKLWRWICGYHWIRVKSPRQTAFLNGCRSKGIRLWQIEQKSGLELRCAVPHSRFNAFCRYCDSFRAEVREEETKGLLPLIMRCLRRRGMAVGLALLAIAAMILSRYVWFIHFSGAEPLRSQLMEQLAAMGVAPGSPWSSLDLDHINNQLMLDNPGLSYLILERKGVTLKGELYLTVEPEPFVVAGRHCDIVADRPGVILEISAYEGTPRVKPGDVVKKGQVLIEGAFPRNEGEEPRFVTARGKILARVWYSASATAPMEVVIKEPTGNEDIRRTLLLGGWRVPLSRDPPFANYIVDHTDTLPIVGLFFPCAVLTERCLEVNLVHEEESYSAAEAAAASQAKELALRTVPEGARVSDTVLSSQTVEEGVEATVYLEVVTELGSPLYFDD